MAKGLRIAKPTFDANTALEKDRVYDSNFNTFKYIKYGIILGATATTYTISHGLGYFPSFIVYVRRGSAGAYTILDPTLDGEGITMQSDKNNLYIINTVSQDILYLLGADDLSDIES